MQIQIRKLHEEVEEERQVVSNTINQHTKAVRT